MIGPYQPVARTVTILSGAATSGAVALNENTLIGLLTPAEFDGTAITFTVCMTLAGTYVALTDSGTGTAVTITAAASRAYSIDPILFLPFKYAKVVANANQTTTDTVITLIIRPVA